MSTLKSDDEKCFDLLLFARILRLFPAFFNHRLDPQNNNPGTGLIGINNGDGDNWGAWGGYHRWENTVDATGGWQTTAWLESNAVFANDNCPVSSLKADLAIRRPQLFKPAAGTMFYWGVDDPDTGFTIQAGDGVVQADGLVAIPQVEVFRENIRKVRIFISNTPVSVDEKSAVGLLILSPNPTTGPSFLKNGFHHIRIVDLNGQIVLEKQMATELDVSILPCGVYFLEILEENGERKMGRFVKT
ncbi:MAG: T9SS type A sorting domain-containing protein [Lewinellaceae bacterium]|nr:T9SS type A sorting domain-containing protein [Lewinellaceae bacterium]